MSNLQDWGTSLFPVPVEKGQGKGSGSEAGLAPAAGSDVPDPMDVSFVEVGNQDIVMEDSGTSENK